MFLFSNFMKPAHFRCFARVIRTSMIKKDNRDIFLPVTYRCWDMHQPGMWSSIDFCIIYEPFKARIRQIGSICTVAIYRGIQPSRFGKQLFPDLFQNFCIEFCLFVFQYDPACRIYGIPVFTLCICSVRIFNTICLTYIVLQALPASVQPCRNRRCDRLLNGLLIHFSANQYHSRHILRTQCHHCRQYGSA